MNVHRMYFTGGVAVGPHQFPLVRRFCRSSRLVLRPLPRFNAFLHTKLAGYCFDLPLNGPFTSVMILNPDCACESGKSLFNARFVPI